MEIPVNNPFGFELVEPGDGHAQNKQGAGHTEQESEAFDPH